MPNFLISKLPSFFLLSFLFIQSLPSITSSSSQINTDNIPIKFLYEESDIIKSFLLNSIQKKANSLSLNCSNSLLKAFNDSEGLYLQKLLHDSSHHIKELGSYYHCLYSIYPALNNSQSSTAKIMNNLTYLLFFVPDSSAVDGTYLFSACIPKGCNNEEYKLIFKEFYKETEAGQTNLVSLVEIYDSNIDTKLNNMFYLGLISLIFFIIILIFDFFPKIPIHLFKCCFKKKKNASYNALLYDQRTERSEDLMPSKNINIDRKHSLINIQNPKVYDMKALNKLIKCFHLSENFTILSDESTLNGDKESGISIIRGLKGICLIIYIIGDTFQALYQSPFKGSSNIKNFNTYPLSFLYFMNRFAGRMLLSLSAYSLCYKFFSYLDKEVEKIEFMERSREDELDDNNLIQADSLFPSLDVGESKSIHNSSENIQSKKNKNSNSLQLNSYALLNTFIESKDYRKAPYIGLFLFIFRQFYKYILFILVILIGRYSYYEIMTFLFRKGPLYEFLKQSIINNFNYYHLLQHILLVFPFIPQTIFAKSIDRLYYQPFDMILQEISFFIFGVIIIFFSYKYNLRLDIFITVGILLILGIKIGFFIIQSNYLFNRIYEGMEKFYPTKDFLQNKWNFLRANPFYNGETFFMGVFFGLVNYCVQKSIRGRNPKRKYVTIPVFYLKIIQKHQIIQIIIYTISMLVFFLWDGCSYNYFFNKKLLPDDTLANNLYEDKGINIYYLIDIDIMIILIYLALMPLLLVGENKISNFLKHHYWNAITRPYYTFMLIICGIINWGIYQAESSINLSISNIILYSSINLIFGTVICILLYCLFEVPLKKLNRLIIKTKPKSKSNLQKKKTSGNIRKEQ